MQELVASLLKEINDNSDFTLQFWSDLLAAELNGGKLEKLGISISKQNQKIKATADKIFAQNPNHLQTLLLFGHY